MQHLRFNTQHQTRMVEEGGAQFIEGYASVFDSTYYVPQDDLHEVVDRSAFDKSLASGQVVESRYNHDRNHVLGRTDLGTLRVWVDDKGLRYKVKYNAADPDHQKVRAKIESGLIEGSSFTFSPVKVKFERQGGKDVARLMDVALYEVGPVNTPCSPASTAAVRSSESGPSLSEQYRLWKATEDRLQKLRAAAK